MAEKIKHNPGTILVHFKNGTTKGDASKLAKSFGLKIEKWFPLFWLLVVEVPEGDEQKWINKFKKDSKVENSCLNYNIPHIQ